MIYVPEYVAINVGVMKVIRANKILNNLVINADTDSIWEDQYIREAIRSTVRDNRLIGDVLHSILLFAIDSDNELDDNGIDWDNVIHHIAKYFDIKLRSTDLFDRAVHQISQL